MSFPEIKQQDFNEITPSSPPNDPEPEPTEPVIRIPLSSIKKWTMRLCCGIALGYTIYKSYNFVKTVIKYQKEFNTLQLKCSATYEMANNVAWYLHKGRPFQRGNCSKKELLDGFNLNK